MLSKRINMADVAAEAGVSKTTVSLALSGNPRISEATRVKIETLAAELGFEPDPAARALCSKRHDAGESGIIGAMAMLVSASHDRVLNPHPDIQRRNEMLAASCRRLGYRMDRFVVGASEKEQKALSRILKARGIRAVLIYGENSEVRDWNLDWQSFAAVTFSGSMREHFVHNVMSSSYQDVYDAVARLAERGYRKPGYFISKQDFDHWQIGLRAAMNLTGHSSNLALCIRDKSMSEQAVREKFITWYQRYQPDLVVSSYAKGYSVLKSIGIKIPDEVGYFSLDAQPHVSVESGLIQLRDVAYKAAVELLHGMLSRHEYGPPQHPICLEIPSEWNEGETLRRL